MRACIRACVCLCVCSRAASQLYAAKFDAAMKTAAHVVSGEFKTGGQSHFCMEKQTTIAVPGEQVDGSE